MSSVALNKKFSLVLPVLFYEYLAISLCKSVIPSMIVDSFGSNAYFAVGVTETVKGLLAFVSCPFFGKISDKIGRKYCLLVTVTGTTLPVVVMAFSSNMYLYSAMLGISGFFSATFPLTFAYISDCVEKRDRAPAFGLALATFGLSFCLGPISGSYLAEQLGNKSVFIVASILVIINIIYILTVLPETAPNVVDGESSSKKFGRAIEYLPNTWNFRETFRIFSMDSFLTNIAIIVFMYYTSVWAIVSTLMVYVVRHLNFSPIALGWLLSGYGIATMFSEGVLVRFIVPWLGELNAMRLGLLSFAVQCVVVAFSQNPVWIYGSVLFSMLANLVYPSISSLVSKLVEEDLQGEALGALNGIKALTEGFGPLIFGFFMTLFESTPTPGSPYLVAGVLAIWALLHSYELPPEPDVLIAKTNAFMSGNDEGSGLLQSRSSGESDSEQTL